MTDSMQSGHRSEASRRGPGSGSTGRRDLREIREALLLLHQKIDAFQADFSREHEDWSEERIRLRQERDELRMQVEALRRQVEGEVPTAADETWAELPSAGPGEAVYSQEQSSDQVSLSHSPAASRADSPERSPGAPAMGAPLLIGWICLFAGTTVHLLTPRVLPGVILPLGLALGLGMVTVVRRRSALVYGLLALAVATPSAILWAEAALEFDGLLASRSVRRAASSSASEAGAVSGEAGGEHTLPITVGQSTRVDRVRIRFDGVTVGPIQVRDVLGQTRTSDVPYLHIDLTLVSEAGDTAVFAKKPWERARLVDDRDTYYGVVEAQRSSLDHLIGAIESTELETGLPVSDRIVFPLPPAESEDFRVIGDPGFYVAGDGGVLRQASAAALRLAFSRSDIQLP